VQGKAEIVWDEDSDSAYIYLSDRREAGMSAHTFACPLSEVHNHMINLDFDAKGCLIGIEVLSASKVLA
jgi:uncharacterized protein YuzE